jgi:hypothetical protein
MHSLLATMICALFDKECGKFQVRQEEPKALKISFSVHPDYDKEEGYRQLDLVVYGPMNYVEVWVRRRWAVIPLEDLEYDEETGESEIKEGRGYQTGASEWERICYHDSCWRTAISDLLFKNQEELSSFDGPTGEPWQVVDPYSEGMPPVVQKR